PPTASTAAGSSAPTSTPPARPTDLLPSSPNRPPPRRSWPSWPRRRGDGGPRARSAEVAAAPSGRPPVDPVVIGGLASYIAFSLARRPRMAAAAHVSCARRSHARPNRTVLRDPFAARAH